MKISTYTSRRKRVFNKGSEVRKVIEASGKKLRKLYTDEFDKRVADWDHKPKFVGRITFKGQDFSVYVFPAGKNKDKWVWTSRGTKKHTIVAVNAPTLRFRENYSARTRPVGQYAVGTGKSSGAWRAPKAVNHPGTRARLFEEDIAKKTENEANAIIRKAVLDAYK